MFDEPVGNGGELWVHGDRTIPVKVRLVKDGQEVRSGNVWLWAGSCDGGWAMPIERLEWRGGRWVGHLDPWLARGGCAAISVRSGGAVFGGFELRTQPCARKSAKGRPMGG